MTLADGVDLTTGSTSQLNHALNEVTTYTWSNGLLQSIEDPLGNITSSTTWAMTDDLRFGHCMLCLEIGLGQQLTAIGGSNTFTYDATGNRTNTGYVTDTGNRLTNDGTWTDTYDAVGNLTHKGGVDSRLVLWSRRTELSSVFGQPRRGTTPSYQRESILAANYTPNLFLTVS